MEYRNIRGAPADTKVSVVWGKESSRPEYGVDLHVSQQWFIYGQSNPHANGRPCVTPDGWLPSDSRELTAEEHRQCTEAAFAPRGLVEELAETNL